MVFVHAIYKDPKTAAVAVDELVEAGFEAQDIGAVVCSEERLEGAPIQHTTGIGVGLATGGIVGGILGALVMALGFTSSTSSPWELGLQGWIAGATFGLLVGVLGGLGYWKVKLHLPKAALRGGGSILLGVMTNEGRVPNAKRALLRAGGNVLSDEMSRALST